MAQHDVDLALGQAAAGSVPENPLTLETSFEHKFDLSSDAEKDGMASTSSASTSPTAIQGQMGEVHGLGPEASKDEERQGLVNFKTMRWWHVAILMIAETISLGILALPSAVSKLGFIPGVTLIVVFGGLATYTGHTIGQFKLAHPSIHTMADAGFVLLGPWGGRIFGIASIMFLTFICGAHVLSFQIMMNVITKHGACTVLFGVVSLVLSMLCCLPRTLKRVSWISIASLISVVSAVFITIVGVAKLHPGGAPDTVAVAPATPVPSAVVAVLDIVMAYSGNVAFFAFLSEMRQPAEYTRALYTLQGAATALYVLVAVVVYHFAGARVASPALSSAGRSVQVAAYVVALPTIVVAGVINGHVAVSMVFKAVRRDLGEEKSRRATAWWVFFCACVWIGAWVLAESVPQFNVLIGLMSALLGSWFTYGISGGFWLKLHRGRWFATPWMGFLTVVNFGLLALGATLCILGTYGSVVDIISQARGKAWSCADNAGS